MMVSKIAKVGENLMISSVPVMGCREYFGYKEQKNVGQKLRDRRSHDGYIFDHECRVQKEQDAVNNLHPTREDIYLCFQATLHIEYRSPALYIYRYY